MHYIGGSSICDAQEFSYRVVREREMASAVEDLKRELETLYAYEAFL